MSNAPTLPPGAMHASLPFGAKRDALIVRALRMVMGKRPGVRLGRVVIALCPSEERAKALQESVCRELGVQPEGIWGSVEGVLGRLAREHSASVSRLSSMTAEHLLRDVFTQVSEQPPSRGALAQAEAALTRIRRALPPAERIAMLEKLAALPGADGQRAKLLADLLQAFDQRARALGRVANADLPWRFADGDAAAAGKSVFDGLPLLIVDDLYRFNPSWQAMLQHACEVAEHTLLISRSSASDSTAASASGGESDNAQNTDAALTHDAASAAFREFCQSYPPAPQDLLEGLELAPSASRQAWLHARTPASVSADDLTQSGVAVAAAESSHDEIQRAIMRIKKLVLDDGAKLSDIRLCFIKPEQEAQARHALKLAGVPYRSEAATPLLQSSAVAALFDLMRAAASGFEREALIAALRSPWLAELIALTDGELDAQAQAAPDAEAFARADQVAPSAAGSLSEWDRTQPIKLARWQRLIGQLAVVSRGARIVAGSPGEGLESAWLPTLRALPEELSKADGDQRLNPIRRLPEGVLPALTALLSKLDALLLGRTQGELLDSLEALMERAGLIRQLALAAESGDPATRAMARTNQRALRRLRSTFSELREGLAMAPREREVSLGMNLLELLDQLQTLGVEEEYPLEGISLSGLLGARGRSAKHLIICGLNDGDFPFPESENAWLAPRMIANLKRDVSALALAALSGDADPLAVYRHLLACALASGEQSLTLSYAAAQEDSALAPSLPLIELCERVAGGEDWLAPPAPRSPPEQSQAAQETTRPLLSARDVQLELARSISRDVPSQRSSASVIEAGQRFDWLMPALAGMATNIERDDLRVIGTAHTGWLGEQSAQLNAQALARNGEAPKFSPSALESYAACPQRFFLRYGLGVDELQRPSLEIGANERGTFVHEVLENFMLKIREVLMDDAQTLKIASTPAAPDGDARELPIIRFDRYEAITGGSVRELLLSTFTEMREASPFHAASFQRWCARVEKSLASDTPSVFSDLSEFLKWERIIQEHGLHPWLMEFSFGNAADEPEYALRDSDDQPRVFFRGSVDRVDVLVEDGAAKALVIRDYKTGGSKLAPRVASGTALQLPLYTLVVQDTVESLETGGFFYHKVRDEVGFVEEASHFSKEVAQALLDAGALSKTKAAYKNAGSADALVNEHTPTRLHAILDAMQSGKFHHTLVDGVASCQYCVYRHACAVRDEKQFAHRQVQGALRDRFGLYAPEPYQT